MHLNKHSVVRFDQIGILLLVCFVFFVMLSAPMRGAFEWQDAPRHAMNGVFIHDLFRDLPFKDPRGWAEAFYAKSPAVTILFYPPLVPVILAIFYALLGISHETALLVIGLFYASLATGTYLLARRMLEPLPAFLAAACLVLAPEVTMWGRQVMLEIPMLALLVWSSWFLFKFVDTSQWHHLIASALLMVAAVNTKQTALLIIPAFVWVLCVSKGISLFKNRRLWFLVIICSIALIPLVILQYKFAGHNLENVVHRPDTTMDRWSIENLGWYLTRLPGMLGVVSLVLALLGLVTHFSGASYKAKKLEFWFGVIWFLVCLIAFSLIALKETRHGILILFPLALFAGIFFQSLAKFKVVQVCGGVTFIALAAYSGVYVNRVQAVGGYLEAAQKIANIATPDSRVLFSGYRDGPFIFALHSVSPRPDVTVVRGDKLWFNIRIMPGFGLGERDLSAQDMRDLFYRYGISYFVVEKGFWNDVPVQKTFNQLMETDDFEVVARIPLTGRVTQSESEIIIYRNLSPIKTTPDTMTINIPAVGEKVTSP
jgi:Dolichyl-phosphate-mannose-protein mannosyltransferase